MSSPPTCALLIFGSLALLACASPPPSPTVLPPTPVPAPTPGSSAVAAPTRPVGVAVAVGSPTATPVLVGDYRTLLRPRLDRAARGLSALNQQLSVLQTTPIRMADQDWRTQTLDILDELAAASRDLRSLGTHVGSQTALNARVTKLLDELDFVVSEYRLAFDYDPDASHFIRAGRVRTVVSDELASLLAETESP